MENNFLEGKKTDTLDVTSASPETSEFSSEENEANKVSENPVQLNSSPSPTPEQVEEANIDVAPENVAPSPEQAEPIGEPEPQDEPVQADPIGASQSDTLENAPVESEPVNPTPELQEDLGVTSGSTKMFTQSQVDDIAGKTRLETREKTFKYIYDRYGVSNEDELDDLIGNAQRYDSLREEYDGAKTEWKNSSSARDKELANLQEQVALMQSGIDSERYDDAKFILKGMGLEINMDNINNALATHPEWKKKESPEAMNPNFAKVGEPQVQPAEPVSKMSVLGNEQAPANEGQSEEDYVLQRMFKV